jgi:hypothetical protein
MDVNKLIALINVALLEVNNLVIESRYYQGDEDIIVNTKKTLTLLKEEALHNPNNINMRILRAMHDIGIASFKYFENWPLEDAINNVTEILYKEISLYKNLRPLDVDFGKGNPI